MAEVALTGAEEETADPGLSGRKERRFARLGVRTGFSGTSPVSRLLPLLPEQGATPSSVFPVVRGGAPPPRARGHHLPEKRGVLGEGAEGLPLLMVRGHLRWGRPPLPRPGGLLAYDFYISGGKDPASTSQSFEGAEILSVEENGSLSVRTFYGRLHHTAPHAYQEIEGERVEVEASFYLKDDHTAGFTLGSYDLSCPPGHRPDHLLVYLRRGGSGGDRANAVVVGYSGAVYVAGGTPCTDLPATPGVYDQSRAGVSDAFLAKVSPSESNLRGRPSSRVARMAMQFPSHSTRQGLPM